MNEMKETKKKFISLVDWMEWFVDELWAASSIKNFISFNSLITEWNVMSFQPISLNQQTQLHSLFEFN